MFGKLNKTKDKQKLYVGIEADKLLKSLLA